MIFFQGVTVEDTGFVLHFLSYKTELPEKYSVLINPPIWSDDDDTQHWIKAIRIGKEIARKNYRQEDFVSVSFDSEDNVVFAHK